MSELDRQKTPHIDPEFRELISPLTAAEREELEASIRRDGCRDALACYGNLLLDGHNRYEICRRLAIPFETKAIDLPDREAAKEWIITNQLARRNTNKFQRARLVLKREEIIKSRAKERQRQGGMLKVPQHSGEPFGRDNETDRRLGKMAGSSHDTIYKTRIIEREASEEVKDKLMHGQTTINREYFKLRPKTQKDKAPPPTKAERIETIRDLASCGFRADQIAAEVGIGIERVRILAQQSGIVLPDAIIGKAHKPNANRIIKETVMAAQSLTAGLQLVDSRLDGIDMSCIDEWIRILGASVVSLNRLINQLKHRRKSNGQ